MITRSGMQALLDRMADAYATCDAKGCAAMFAEDAQVHSPFAPPAVGRSAIEALHLEWAAEPSEKAFSILECGSEAHLAWCLCRFAEGSETGTGTSLIVLNREADGDWRIKSCCLFGDPV